MWLFNHNFPLCDFTINPEIYIQQLFGIFSNTALKKLKKHFENKSDLNWEQKRNLH